MLRVIVTRPLSNSKDFLIVVFFIRTVENDAGRIELVVFHSPRSISHLRNQGYWQEVNNHFIRSKLPFLRGIIFDAPGFAVGKLAGTSRVVDSSTSMDVSAEKLKGYLVPNGAFMDSYTVLIHASG